MGTTAKEAQERSSSPSAELAASPVPPVAIQPTFAPGKRGPVGTSPRTNYSRVNTGSPPTPDAGAEAQKSMAPRGAEMLPQKVASTNEDSMGTMTGRPRLQDMVKAAMTSSVERLDITKEAARQAANLGEEKTANENCPKCGKGMPCPEHSKAAATEKKGSAEYALKLAAAVEFIAENMAKEGASLGGAYHLTGHVAKGPEGVSQATKSETFPPHQGQGHHQPPMHPGLQKGLKTEQSATQLENTLDHAAGGKEKMIQTNYGKKTAGVVELIRSKTAAAKPDEKVIQKAASGDKSGTILDHIRGLTKKAEDAINPAHISAGAAVAPETSAAGESGGHPAGGAPQGPTGLVGSNESAQNYTKGQAYANRKADLKQYLSEPALSSETDKTLQQAFEHTGQAGTKFSSAEGLSTKTAAAKALLAKLAEEAGAAAEPERRSA